MFNYDVNRQRDWKESTSELLRQLSEIQKDLQQQSWVMGNDVAKSLQEN